MLRAGIRKFLDTKDDGKAIGSSKLGVYAFYDYDGEPIYVGQTRESLRQRISRHMTNQRTDAVAMNVLDPFEVAEIEVWPIDQPDEALVAETLNRAEFTVFQKLLRATKFGAVLNEAAPRHAEEIELPKSHRGKIVPDDVFLLRKHPDIRIARRASTIANLARVISERDVSPGLRVTLLTQAKRLSELAGRRVKELEIESNQLSERYPETTAAAEEI